MADRKDNSALIALSELRSIEEDRIKQEEEDEKRKRAAEEARRRAEEEARRAAEEAKRQAEEAARKADEEKRRKEELEAHLRLQETERRARIEAEAHIAAKRIEAEVHAAAVHKKPPLGLIFGIVGGLVVVAGGLIGYMYMQKAKSEEQAALAQRERDELEKANTEMKAEFTRIQEKLDRQIAAAKSAEDIQKAKAEAEAARKAAEDARTARVSKIRRAPKAGDTAAPGTKKVKINDSDNPL
jgi:membrane protein involved in colicin uptake